MVPKRRILVCCVAMGSQFLLACVPTKGYVGAELPSEKVALVRARSAENYFGEFVHVELMHPLTAEWVGESFSKKKTGWASVLPPSACITVRARGERCTYWGSYGGTCSSSDMSWSQAELCFAVDVDSRYEIQALSRLGLPCDALIHLTGFRVVDLESKEALAELSLAYECPPLAE